MACIIATCEKCAYFIEYIGYAYDGLCFQNGNRRIWNKHDVCCENFKPKSGVKI